MKKYIVLITALLLVCTLLGCNNVTVTKGTATISFVHNELNIYRILTDEEVDTIVRIFDGNKLFSDSPECSFSEEISIKIGDSVYAIARDECPIVWDCKSGQYFRISDEQRAEIIAIFGKYGGYFPCL